MIHALATLLAQLILWVLTGSPLLGGIFMSGFYVGRELAQAEYRAILTYYGGKRANAPWYCGFEPRAWDLKSGLDCGLPCVTTGIVALIWKFAL